MTPGKPIFRFLFAVPWIVFGAQHFMYADFVTTLVPAWIPAKAFWVYATGTGMICGGLGLMIRKTVRPAAAALAGMLVVFLFLVHVPILTSGKALAINRTRALQDLLLALTAGLLLVKGRSQMALFGLFWLGFGVMGSEHFFLKGFVTPKIAAGLPGEKGWHFAVGAAMVFFAVRMLWKIRDGWKIIDGGGWRRFPGAVLGFFTLWYFLPLFFSNPFDAQSWTAAMLDLGLTAGAFIAAGPPPASRPEIFSGLPAARNRNSSSTA